MDKQFTEGEIVSEIEKAKSFQPRLKKLYFATTALKDVKIETLVRKINIENLKNQLFEIHLFSWEDIVDLIDELVESVSGVYGRPVGYSVETLQNYSGHQQLVKYYKDLYDFVQKERKTIYQDTWIQNQIDEIAQLIAQTRYLLTLS